MLRPRLHRRDTRDNRFCSESAGGPCSPQRPSSRGRGPTGTLAFSLLIACVFNVAAQGSVGSPLPLLGPWLCASVLLSRGFHRAVAYGFVAASIMARFVASQLVSPTIDTADADSSLSMMITVLGCACLVIAE